MPLKDETVGIEELAEALGQDADWLKRNWLRLHRRDGFPRKIAGGWVWPRRLVTAYLRSGGLALPLPENDNAAGAPIDPIAAASAALSERYVR